MKKRIFALGMSAVLAVSLAACSSDNADSDSNGGSSSAVEATSAGESKASDDASEEDLSYSEKRDINRYVTVSPTPGNFKEVQTAREEMLAFIDPDADPNDNEPGDYFFAVASVEDNYEDVEYDFVQYEFTKDTALTGDEVSKGNPITVDGEEASTYFGQTDHDGTYYSVRAALVDRGNDVYVLFIASKSGTSQSEAELHEDEFKEYLTSVKWAD